MAQFALVKEVQHARLEHLVADRQHVVAVGDIESARAGNERGQFVRAAGDLVLGADRDQHRHPNAGHLLAAQRSARAAHAGGERPAGRIWSVRRSRGTAAAGSVTSASDGASSAAAMFSRQTAMPVDQIDAEPAENRRTHARGMVEREEGGDARAHRVAHDVGARDARDDRAARARRPPSAAMWIVGGIVELARGAVAAIVERDDAAAGAGQRAPSRDRPSSPPWSRQSRAPARSARPRPRRDRRSRRRHVGNSACCDLLSEGAGAAFRATGDAGQMRRGRNCGCRPAASRRARFAMAQHVGGARSVVPLSADDKGRTALSSAPKIHDARSNARRREHDRAAAEQLEDGARLAAFFFGELGHPRHFARTFGELETVERGLRAGLGLHAADVADEAHQPAGLSTLTASRAARTATAGSIECRRPRFSAPSRPRRAASGRSSAIGADPPGLARGLDQRQADARRRGDAERRIGAGGDGNADAGQAEHQFVDVFAARSGCPRAARSRISPNTNRSPSAVPASAAMSSGSPVISPRAKLAALRLRGGRLRRRRFRPSQRAPDRLHMPRRRRDRRSSARDRYRWPRAPPRFRDCATRGVECAVERAVGDGRADRPDREQSAAPRAPRGTQQSTASQRGERQRAAPMRGSRACCPAIAAMSALFHRTIAHSRRNPAQPPIAVYQLSHR